MGLSSGVQSSMVVVLSRSHCLVEGPYGTVCGKVMVQEVEVIYKARMVKHVLLSLKEMLLVVQSLIRQASGIYVQFLMFFVLGHWQWLGLGPLAMGSISLWFTG